MSGVAVLQTKYPLSRRARRFRRQLEERLFQLEHIAQLATTVIAEQGKVDLYASRSVKK